MKRRILRLLISVSLIAVVLLTSVPITAAPIIPVNIVVPEGRDFVITNMYSGKYQVNFAGTDADISLSAGVIQFSKWDKESLISLRLPDSIASTLKLTSKTANLITWENADYAFTYSPTGFVEGFNDEGGLDLSITVKRPQPGNTIDFTLDATSANAYLQPPLTEKEIAEGDNRPDYVVNSIAFYGTGSQVNNRYKTGKIGHLYRMKVNGKWADWGIEGNMITLTIPEITSYPATIIPLGDTFGYTSTGGSTIGIEANIANTIQVSAPADGDAVDIKAYGKSNSGTTNIKALIFTHNDLNLIANGVGEAAATINSYAWYTSTFAVSPTLTNGTSYLIGFIDDASLSFGNKYDDGSTYPNHIDASNSYASPQNMGSCNTNNYIYSIYCDYTGTNPPDITSVDPDWGSTVGGETITIGGTGFVAGTTIKFGGVPATNVNIVSTTEITCTTPAGTYGLQDVFAENENGDDTLEDGYLFIQAVANVSTVSEVEESSWGYENIGEAFQRKVFMAEGRSWVFFSSVNTMYYTSSTDGIEWETPTLLVTGQSAFMTSLYFDGTYVHVCYAHYIADDPIYYRRGNPNSDGTVTWANEQTAYTPPSGYNLNEPIVVADSSGYAWIGFCICNGSANWYAKVTKNANNDGTWSTDFTTDLADDADTSHYTVTPIALTEGKVYVIYYNDEANNKYKGKLYNSGWGSEEDCSTSYGGVAYWNAWSVIAEGDNIHLAFLKDTGEIIYAKRTYGVGWSAETSLVSGLGEYVIPSISINGTELSVFWAISNKIYVINYNGASWGSPAIAIDETNNTITHKYDYTVVRVASSDLFSIAYRIRGVALYFVRYASYTADEAIPTLTTDTADDIEDTTATLNGTITDDAGETIDYYGFVWDDDSDEGDPGDIDPSTPAGDWEHGWKSTEDDWGEISFDHGITGLPTGMTIYFRACIHYDGGEWIYGDSDDFLTKPAAPTNVAATDGTENLKVVVTWTKSTGATGYRVYQDGDNVGGLLGDVATYDDTDADASVITPGTASATDGTATDKATLSISGASIANGTTHTYKVVAVNASGNSDDSSTNTGYRGHGSLTYQWYVSAADSDASFSELAGATTAPYDDSTAPAPTITPGAASASDGTSPAHVALSIAGATANEGAGRYYYCTVSATGAANQNTTHNRGYRGVGALTYQWQRSAADSDADYSNIDGATTSSYNDTDGATEPDGRYYKCVINATGAAQQITTVNRGYMSAGGASRTVNGISDPGVVNGIDDDDIDSVLGI